MNRLIIASAGGGKTTCLVDKALSFNKGKVLITTFTNANEEQIRSKIYQKTGCIPSNIIVQSWWSFLLEHGARPYQGGLYEKAIGGIRIVSGKSGVKFQGKKFPIYYSETKDFERFYFSKDSDLFYDKISRFVLKCDSYTKGKVFERISKCFQLILIDEIQDFAGEDLDILKKLFLAPSDVILVGDPRQGTYSTSNAAKNKKFRKSKIVHFFEDDKMDVEVDDTSLVVNHRCIKSICDLSNELYPGFKRAVSGNSNVTGHDGVFYLKKNEVDAYLEAHKPMQLRHSRAVVVNEKFESMNIGVSKGLEFERVLIYPTKAMEAWLKDHSSKLEDTTRSSLYVALTRARQSVAIVCAS